MHLALRLAIQPKPHNSLRIKVFVPSATGGWYGAGALHVSEIVWRVLLYPILSAGATRCGVTLTLES